jgi:hypothetical protein
MRDANPTAAQRATIAKLARQYEGERERYDAGLEHVVVVFVDDEHESIEHLINPDGRVTSTRRIDI